MSIRYNHAIIYAQISRSRSKMMRLLGLFQQAGTLLEAFIAATVYVRNYDRWLLKHAEEVQQMHGRSHLRGYGLEVQHVLFLV